MVDSYKVALAGKDFLVRDESLDYASLERVYYNNEYLFQDYFYQ